jgi:hypothetical protein
MITTMAKSNALQNPMTQDELLALQNSVTDVSLRDVAVGRVLDVLVSHLARLNNLDYPVSVEPEAAPTEEAPADQAVAPGQEGV